ncbi:hypothetical protein [Bacillus pseudomycoides]|nr:hypothetical protein [Bacillus pseudomycoides]MED1476547.1 hypothetical protein [Bacillus pseudomycoides]
MYKGQFINANTQEILRELLSQDIVHVKGLIQALESGEEAYLY